MMRDAKFTFFLIIAITFVYNTVSSEVIEHGEGIHGYLTWTNINSNLYYTVEYQPNLKNTDDWDGSYRALQDIQSSDPIISVPVSRFFRIVASETQLHTRAFSADSTEVHAGYYEATNLTAVSTNLVPENIRAGVSIFGISGHPNVLDTSGGTAVPADIAQGRTAWVNGTEVTGTANIMVNPAPVPKTGQTTRYRTGDDGNIKMGVAWPVPRFTDNGNGTITDNLTGLMWVKAPHSLPNNNIEKASNHAFTFCSDLVFAGRSDWRLPNIRELMSLMEYGDQVWRHLPQGHPFSGIKLQSEKYYSGTFCHFSTTQNFKVQIGQGSSTYSSMSVAGWVWPVRAGH